MVLKCLLASFNNEIEVEFIEECFQHNTTLEGCGGDSNFILKWYTMCNRICNKLGATIQHRNSIPRNLSKEDQINSFIRQLLANSSEWRVLKLVTLGHGRIGKTTLLNKLRLILNPNDRVEVRKNFYYSMLIVLQNLEDTKSTIGIDCNTISLAGGEISVWDFAGQLEYISTHQFFLSIEV